MLENVRTVFQFVESFEYLVSQLPHYFPKLPEKMEAWLESIDFDVIKMIQNSKQFHSFYTFADL